MGPSHYRNLLLVLSVVLSAHVPTAFQITRCPRPPCSGAAWFYSQQPREGTQLQLARNDAEYPKASKRPYRYNKVLREVQQCIRKKYPAAEYATSSSSLPAEWQRFRNYLYYACSERLSLQLDQVQQVLDYLEELFPNDHDLHVSILKLSPTILGKPVDTFLRPTVEFLVDLYGIELFTEAVRREKDLLLKRGLGGNAVPLHPSVPVYLTEQLGLPPTDVSKLERNNPDLFQRPVHKIQAVVSFIGEILHHGNVTEQDIQTLMGKIVINSPRVFLMSVPIKLKPQLECLETLCHLTTAELAKALMFPKGAGALLAMSVDENLKPTLTYLSQIVSAGENGDLKRIILRHPAILIRSLPNIESKVEYFDSLGPPDFDENGKRVPSQGLAARVMIRLPSVYTLSLPDNIMPKVEFFRGVWNASSDRDGRSVAALLGEMPPVLGLNLESNIQPTLQFYNRTGYTTLDSNWQLIHGGSSTRVIRGKEICVSLFSRLLPRWHVVRAIFENTTEPMPSPLIPLRILASSTDADFCNVYNVSLEDYANYKTEEAIQEYRSQFDAWLETGRPIEVTRTPSE